jgi:hypothetical protein
VLTHHNVHRIGIDIAPSVAAAAAADKAAVKVDVKADAKHATETKPSASATPSNNGKRPNA